jgi:hypothetical protein
MKKVILFLSLVAIIMASCTKDSTSVTDLNNQSGITYLKVKTPTADSLPSCIRDSVAARFPGYVLDSIVKERRRDSTITEVDIYLHVDTTFYVLDYTPGSCTFHLDDRRGSHGDDHDGNHGGRGSGCGRDGHGEQGHGVHTVIANSAIGAAATAYINANFAGYTIQKAVSEIENGVTTYEVRIGNNTSKITLIFNSNWVFLRRGH